MFSWRLHANPLGETVRMPPNFYRMDFPDTEGGEPFGLQRGLTIGRRHLFFVSRDAQCIEERGCVMAKSSMKRSGSLKSDTDVDHISDRIKKKKPGGSLEILLLGLLSACIGFLLFLVFFRS